MFVVGVFITQPQSITVHASADHQLAADWSECLSAIEQVETLAVVHGIPRNA